MKNMKTTFTSLLVFGAILLSRPAQAATVTTTADSGPGSLRDAIANAVPGETINFSGVGTIMLTSGELVIDKNLIISGPGAGNLLIQRSTANGTPDFRIFDCSATVIISGLTVSNGRGDFGGGVYNDGDLTLNDCVVTGNFAASGGGIENDGTMTISRCVVQGNSAVYDAGDGFGGGVYNLDTLAAVNCLISGNSVTSGTGNGFGGGIENEFGTLTLTSCIINGNSATGSPNGGSGFGGGIDNELGTVYVDASTMSGNVARGGASSGGGLAEGGGVANGFGTVYVDSSTVSGNNVVGGNGGTGSGGSSEGGGIANDSGGTVYVDSSTVSGNVSSPGAGTSGNGLPYGGGIFNGSGSMIVTYSTIAYNAVPGGFPNDGGGIYNFDYVELDSTIVAANTATVDLFTDSSGFGETWSDGFNVIGSTSGLIFTGLGDQTGITAAELNLGPLQNNGGPTFTHALLCGSLALNAGDLANAPATDQRGFPRTVNGTIDIGAYESGNQPPTIICPDDLVLSNAPPAGQSATLSVNLSDPNGDPLIVVWTVDGIPAQTNLVAGGTPPTSASVNFTSLFTIGLHEVGISVSDPSQCSATCSLDVSVFTSSGQPQLALIKTVSSANPDVGDPVTYFYAVTNTGNVTITNINIMDDNGTPTDTSDDYYVNAAPFSLAPGQGTVFAVAHISEPLCLTYGGSNLFAGTLTVNTLTNGNVEVFFIQSQSIDDNRYGSNGGAASGWPNGPAGHKFNDLVGGGPGGGPQATFLFTDASGKKVLEFQADYISSAKDTTFPAPIGKLKYPSGYGTLGVTGGDGKMLIGKADNVLFVETTLSGDLNQSPAFYGYTANSPAETTPMSNNSIPPGWNYALGYHVIVSANAFGAAGFGGVTVPVINNVKSKLAGLNSFAVSNACACVVNTAVATAFQGTNLIVAAFDNATVCFGVQPPCVTMVSNTPPYPFTSTNPLTSIPFNESGVLRASVAVTAAGTSNCVVAHIALFYNDEHAMALGVKQVVVKTASGTTTTNYPITPLLTVPASVTNPFVGSTIATGDQAGADVSGRPLFPALFLTDITANPNSLSGDWQYGGTAIPPTAIFGTWKGFVKTVDKTRSPATVSLTADADPTKNNWVLGPGSDPVPNGLSNEGYGAEARWDVPLLGLVRGHTYRFYFMVHDGDQNKAGGDAGQACATITIP